MSLQTEQTVDFRRWMTELFQRPVRISHILSDKCEFQKYQLKDVTCPNAQVRL